MKGEYGEVEERKRGMLTTGEWCNPCSQQHVAPCVEGVEWGLHTRDFRTDRHHGLFSLDCRLSVEVIQQDGVDPRRRRAAIGTPF